MIPRPSFPSSPLIACPFGTAKTGHRGKGWVRAKIGHMDCNDSVVTGGKSNVSNDRIA